MNTKFKTTVSRSFLRALDEELGRIESEPNYEEDFREWKERRMQAEILQRTEN